MNIMEESMRRLHNDMTEHAPVPRDHPDRRSHSKEVSFSHRRILGNEDDKSTS